MLTRVWEVAGPGCRDRHPTADDPAPLISSGWLQAMCRRTRSRVHGDDHALTPAGSPDVKASRPNPRPTHGPALHRRRASPSGWTGMMAVRLRVLWSQVRPTEGPVGSCTSSSVISASTPGIRRCGWCVPWSIHAVDSAPRHHGVRNHEMSASSRDPQHDQPDPRPSGIPSTPTNPGLTRATASQHEDRTQRGCGLPAGQTRQSEPASLISRRSCGCPRSSHHHRYQATAGSPIPGSSAAAGRMSAPR